MLPRFRHSHSAIRVLLEWIYTGYLLHSFWRSTLLFYGILDGLCIRKNWWLMLWGNRPCYFWPKGLEIHQFLHDRYQYWICDHLYCPFQIFRPLLLYSTGYWPARLVRQHFQRTNLLGLHFHRDYQLSISSKKAISYSFWKRTWSLHQRLCSSRNRLFGLFGSWR